MKDNSSLGSYKWISICKILIIIVTIILAVASFAAGIFLSINYRIAWLFAPTFIGGILASLLNYFFGMLFLSLLHNVHMIKSNIEKDDIEE